MLYKHGCVVFPVGHEIDFTISDFVSDKRAATPSAAAELVIPSQKELMEIISNYKRSLSMRMEAKTGAAKRQLEYLISRPVFAKKDLFYKSKMQEIDDYNQKLGYAYEKLLNAHQKRYEIAVHNLERLSPLNTLKRGYSLVSHEERLIKSKNQVKTGDVVEITVTDGSFKAKVCEKE